MHSFGENPVLATDPVHLPTPSLRAQVSITAFLPVDNATAFNVLRDLQLEPRSDSAVGSTQGLTEMFLLQPVDTWQDYISNLDMPNYFLTFSALICNGKPR